MLKRGVLKQHLHWTGAAVPASSWGWGTPVCERGASISCRPCSPCCQSAYRGVPPTLQPLLHQQARRKASITYHSRHKNNQHGEPRPVPGFRVFKITRQRPCACQGCRSFMRAADLQLGCLTVEAGADACTPVPSTTGADRLII